MKLSQFYQGKRLISEGRVDPNVLLSLQNIIKAGKAHETMQFIVLARLIDFFKTGRFYKETNFYDVFLDTSPEVLKTVKDMKAEDQVKLAQKLLGMCEIKDKDLLASFANPTQEAIAWINFITAHEDR